MWRADLHAVASGELLTYIIKAFSHYDVISWATLGKHKFQGDSAASQKYKTTKSTYVLTSEIIKLSSQESFGFLTLSYEIFI
jgi:hypothetical protein